MSVDSVTGRDAVQGVSVAAPGLRAASPLSLQPHQEAAVAAVSPALVRQQVIMACGSGKTLVGQYAVQKLLGGGGGAVLVTVPTLTLLQQTYEAWAEQAPFAFEALAVCSKLTAAERTDVGTEEQLGADDLTLPALFVAEDGFKLGAWVVNQRNGYAAGRLSAECVAELEAVPGWVWNVGDSRWEEGVASLRAYVQERGDARVPKAFVSEGGFALGQWVSTRRKDYVTGRLSAERVAELEAVPGWVWNVGDSRWEEGIGALLAYAEEHGDARVPKAFVSEGGFALGQWVLRRRKDYVTGRLSAERVAELEAVPGWVWNARGGRR